VPVQRRALALRRTHIGDGKTLGAGFDMGPQRRVLGDAHAHHVDDLALVGWQTLVEER
jgi:hypothetical protein